MFLHGDIRRKGQSGKQLSVSHILFTCYKTNHDVCICCIFYKHFNILQAHPVSKKVDLLPGYFKNKIEVMHEGRTLKIVHKILIYEEKHQHRKTEPGFTASVGFRRKSKLFCYVVQMYVLQTDTKAAFTIKQHLLK